MMNKTFNFLFLVFGLLASPLLIGQTTITGDITLTYETPGDVDIIIPDGCTVDIEYEIWGGGGGGGFIHLNPDANGDPHPNTPRRAAPGGGGGGYSTGSIIGQGTGTYTVTVGFGGIMHNGTVYATTKQDGTNSTAFGITSAGGKGGAASGAGAGGNGDFNGGAGGVRDSNGTGDNASGGGGGGGCGQVVTAGGNAMGSTAGSAGSPNGGAGGAAGSDGLDATAPGGGGGGKGSGGDIYDPDVPNANVFRSGNGADGKITLIITNYACICYPQTTSQANGLPGILYSNPANCDIAAGEPNEVITIPDFDCADAVPVSFETPVLPANPSVLYHYWGNCSPNSPSMPIGISAKANGYIQQMFCETDAFGLPAFTDGLSGENGTINFLPQETEDVGCLGFAQVNPCTCGGFDQTEQEAELIQIDFWMAVPDLQPQVGFRFSTNAREDAASFFVGPELGKMCEVAYFTDGSNHDDLVDQNTGTYNIDAGIHTGTCGLLWMRVRVYISDIAAQFEVNPEINAGAGWVSIDQLLIEPALSALDNTVPTVTTNTVSGYIIDDVFVYDDGGTWDPYGCNPVTGVPDEGVCNLLDVELSKFNVIAKKESAVLNWTTLSESNSDKFIIERSDDGKSFSSIGEVQSNGNSHDKIDYKFIDTRPLSGTSYYRLQEISLDGNRDYSKIVSIDFMIHSNIEVYPNPATDQLFWKNVNENLSYKMINVHGQEVSSGLVNKSNEALDLSTFSGGLYFMKIYNQNKEITQIVKVYVN